jgi:hypothetical protein
VRNEEKSWPVLCRVAVRWAPWVVDFDDDIQFLLRTEKSYYTLKVFGGGGGVRTLHCT